MSTNAPPFGGDLKLADHVSDKPTNETPPPPYHYEKGLVTSREWISENLTSDFLGRVKRYLVSLFPIFSWIYRYNLTWALGGMTISRMSANHRSHRRVDGRRRSCASEYVICEDCYTTRRIWSLFVVCGCIYLLFLRYIQRRYHRPRRCHVSANSSSHTKRAAVLSKLVHRSANCHCACVALWIHHSRDRTYPSRIHR